MLCNDREGRIGEGGKEAQRSGGGIYAYLKLIHTVEQQKLTQNCTAIIPQFTEETHTRGDPPQAGGYMGLQPGRGVWTGEVWPVDCG